MRTSYSALATYTQCPQKYKFQEIDRIPAPKGREAIFGTVVHSALKFMFDRNPLFPTLDEVVAFFRRNFSQKFGGEEQRAFDVYCDEGIRMLKAFYLKNAPWNFSVVDLESRFEVPITDEETSTTHTLAGVIDRIDKLEDGYEIIDYKTARKLPSQEKVDHDLQLSLYSLGLQKKWPHIAPEKIRLSLYFVKHGEKLSTVRTKDAIEATRSSVLSTIREIQKKVATAERFPPSPSPLCDWCAYKPICPAWKHLYRKQEREGTLEPDEIGKTLKEYFSLAAEKDRAEERMGELKRAIREYMEREGYDRVFGDDGSMARSLQKRFAYDAVKVRAILDPIGKWQDILAVDTRKLQRVLQGLSPDIRAKVEAARFIVKEFTVMTASAKKETPGVSGVPHDPFSGGAPDAL